LNFYRCLLLSLTICLTFPCLAFASEEEPPAWLLPFTIESSEVQHPIIGKAEVDKQALVDYIRQNNPEPKLQCSLEELIDYYYEEAEAEGIRPDLAVCQAIKETGFFNYGGDVIPEQNNYCGLGTTGGGVQGAYFVSPRIGVRAQIQHLLAYTTTRLPVNSIVDPRYELLRSLPQKFAQCPTWESLNGHWAVPGVDYGQSIIRILENVKMNSLYCDKKEARENL